MRKLKINDTVYTVHKEHAERSGWLALTLALGGVPQKEISIPSDWYKGDDTNRVHTSGQWIEKV